MRQVLGHQAVLVLEAVYKHVTVELLASSTEDKLHNMIYNHDPNIQLIEEYVNVWVLLKDSSSAQ